MNINEAIARYGSVINGEWEEQSEWMSLLQVPAELSQSWINSVSGGPTSKIYSNKDFQGPLISALQNVVTRGLVHQLKTYDGCFCLRDVRGQPGIVSAHSYGIAIDINSSTNSLGTDGDMTDDLAKCFTDAGLLWGKAFTRKDPQHFSLGW